MPNNSDPYLQFLSGHLHSDRANSPGKYIEWVKRWPRYSDGSLERLPKKAIILHDSKVEEHLAILGVSFDCYEIVRTGTMDPNILYIIYNNQGEPSLLINRGLPGGGGVTTQAAELYALGVVEIVHIGTCALMGNDVPKNSIVLSTGAYKDGASVLLSSLNESGLVEPLAVPDVALTDKLETAVSELGSTTTRSIGFTIGSFYFQPESLIKDLVLNRNLPGNHAVGHIEMEESGLFTIAERMNCVAASLVVGSDRYNVLNGNLTHKFEENFDQDNAEHVMIKAAALAMQVKLF